MSETNITEPTSDTPYRGFVLTAVVKIDSDTIIRRFFDGVFSEENVSTVVNTMIEEPPVEQLKKYATLALSGDVSPTGQRLYKGAFQPEVAVVSVDASDNRSIVAGAIESYQAEYGTDVECVGHDHGDIGELDITAMLGGMLSELFGQDDDAEGPSFLDGLLGSLTLGKRNAEVTTTD